MSAYSDLILAEPTLTGYWRMNDVSSPAVDSKNANNGTQVNGPTFGAAGILPNTDGDTAISFASASSQYLTVASNVAINLGDVLTLECWVKNINVTGGHAFITKGGAYQLSVFNGTPSLNRQGIATICSGTALSTATTYHLAATKNGATSKFYINGVDVTIAGTNSTMGNTGNALFLGADVGPSGFMSGTIQHAAIYTTALSAASILAHYNAGLASSTANGPWRSLLGVGM